MDLFGKRHRFVVAMLMLSVPVITGAEGKGCKGPGAGDGGAVEPAPAGPVKPGKCVVTGCSGQVCSDRDVVTTCEWREEYACYGKFSTCERDASGECGWRETPELEACLGGGGEPEPEPEPGDCVVTGCSGQICADDHVVTDCEWREEYACYAEHGTCERDASGACGWRETPELEACLGGGGEPAPCVVTGCSGQVCADDHVVTTCEWREEYACYGKFSTCERDASGACGWRETPELEECIEAASGDGLPVGDL